MVSCLVALLLLTGGIFIERIEMYSPDLSIRQSQGEFTPYIDYGIESKTITLIPWFLYFVSIKPTHTFAVQLSSYVYGLKYARFEYVIFNSLKIDYSSGGTQTIVPSNSPIEYYSDLTKGKVVSILPTAEKMESTKFKVCDYDYRTCFGWIGPIRLDEFGPFRLTIAGRYFSRDGTEKQFHFSQLRKKVSFFRLNTGWNKLGSV